jgi:SPW repeat-containing protein
LASPVPVAAGLADEWWYWLVVAGALLGATALSGRYRAWAARLRASAVRRRLVELPLGRSVRRQPAGFWSDLSWIALAAGVWVALAPWTWGYEDVDGAIATDVVTGGIVIALTLAAIIFPGLWALVLLAGAWLVIAPWLVGYGDAHGGAVGLSDTVAGIVICVVAIISLATSQRALRSGDSRAIGRIRPRN